MAEAKRKKRERYVSPTGRFIYPWLNTPDTKFDADGVYRVKLAVPATEAASLVESFEARYADHLANNKAGVRKEGVKPWKLDEETNEYIFTFKMNAKVTSKKTGKSWTQRPALFDSAGAPVGDVKVGGGTKGKISFEIIPYANNMIGASFSLRMKAVQILDLVEFGQANAEAYGFEQAEGYTAETNSDFENEEADGSDEDHDF